jgi:hypothetical protein
MIGPYKNCQKGLLLLFQLVSGNFLHNSGNPNTEMFIPSSSYEVIWKKFYIDNYNELNKWADDFLQKYFSNIKIRILYSHINNPELFESVTMIADSKDIFVILSREDSEFRQNKSGKSNLISRKNGWRNAGKTNFIIDSQNYLINLSSTYGSNSIYDSEFIFIQKIEEVMDKNDVIVFIILINRLQITIMIVV